MSRERGWTLALATVGVVVVLDQLTKAWVRADVAQRKLEAMGSPGSERSTRRACFCMGQAPAA